MAEQALGPDAGQSRVASDEAFSIETHGVNTIPPQDRHGHPKELFFVWAAANTNYIYLILGSLIISFGVGFWPAVVAIIVAHSFYLLLGAAAIPGPKAGTATMVVSRSAFGVKGNGPYAFLSWLTTVGWEAVFIVVATLALVQLGGLAHLSGSWVKVLALAIIVAATFIVAIFGHATIVLMQRILTYALGVGMVVLAIFVLPKSHLGGFHVHAVAAGTPAATWILAVEVLVAGSAMSWMNYPADYARYLRSTEPSRAVWFWTALGPIIPAIGISIIGAAAGTAANMTDPVGGLRTLVPTWFFAVFLLIVIGGAVANNFLNTYSSGMSLLALRVRVSRPIAVAADGVVATCMATYALFVSNFVGSFQNFLALMVLWIAPWAGVYLADIWVHRNTYDAPGLQDTRGGPYWYRSGWNFSALVAFAVGVVCAYLFTNATLLRGPLVSAISGADISVFVGLAVSFCLYLTLATRSARAMHFAAQPSAAAAE
jgi:NCS1 family nucleobase:cation symporter-1